MFFAVLRFVLIFRVRYPPFYYVRHSDLLKAKLWRDTVANKPSLYS